MMRNRFREWPTLNPVSMAVSEVIHNMSGLADPDIQKALPGLNQGPSENIGKKLEKDCF